MEVTNPCSYSNYTTNISHASNFFIPVYGFNDSKANFEKLLGIWGFDTGN